METSNSVRPRSLIGVVLVALAALPSSSKGLSSQTAATSTVATCAWSWTRFLPKSWSKSTGSRPPPRRSSSQRSMKSRQNDQQKACGRNQQRRGSD
uniref:Putative secreted peptide n=1 Tax=Anopheles braziliensis TaxID=58242 RepID=A0A2M3ZTK0_9DIPT